MDVGANSDGSVLSGDDISDVVYADNDLGADIYDEFVLDIILVFCNYDLIYDLLL